MTTPGYDSDYDFDDYPSRDPRVTAVGLPPGQLALIIGVNAVISLIISVVVVLIATRQAAPGSVAQMPAAVGTPAATVSAGEPTATPGQTAAAENTPTPVTPVGSVTYEVQAGDTLGQIASKFSVSVFDLMLANGLSDEDFIQIGQQLEIPLGGLPTVTATFTPVALSTETPLPFDPPTPIPTEAQGPPEPAVTVGPSPTPTATSLTPSTGAGQTGTPAAAPASVTKIVITEVINGGSLPDEMLIVLNQGAGSSMLNWKLSGSSLGNFVFPDIFLFSGGSIRIHTVAGQNTPSDLYLGQSEPAWPSGTTIILSDNTGAEVSTYTVP